MSKVAIRRRVDAFLAERDATHAWLAGQAGISTPHLSLIVNGRRSPSFVVALRLSKITGIPAEEFLPRHRRVAA